MLNQLRQKKKEAQAKNQGFTIIEVMIVLVIAAVIILIVFLAVPALQRNSRNNQRKNDVARVSAAVSEHSSNNNGQLPTTYVQIANNVGTLGFYTTPTGNVSTGAQAAVTDQGTIRVVTGATCVVATDATIAGTARQFAVQYAVEVGGTGTDPQCLQG
ncbi:MAG: prepilin-type N-terminal cleavage/methylation domain-containing protein [bacterium]|nr:prepilin-type N-terminal cleavage/methylation domain-containing protein [bacterium]